MLRGYCKYLLQVGVPFSQSYVEETLRALSAAGAPAGRTVRGALRSEHRQREQGRDQAGHGALRAAARRRSPAATRPRSSRGAAGDRGARRQARRAGRQPRAAALKALLDRVASLDEDRILRSFIGVIDATLRTSYYIQYKDGERADGGPADYISFKFDSAQVPDLPKPRPYREIFVYGPRVEGVHLRFGPVARGGLRWSDRREDFRTEVLGLVKAQMVKNTVIVPVGSKGGFFVQAAAGPGGDRDAWFSRRRRLLQALHQRPARHHRQPRSDGKVVPRPTWCATTATIRTWSSPPTRAPRRSPTSPTASRRAHGFWLDDAFASGGSVGYDHKGMGITAQGRVGVGQAPLPRHGPRLARRRTSPCVGIGDMSGDVFGNGMLLSQAHPPAGRVRPPPHLPRPEPGCGDVVQGTRAHVQAAALELGRLRQDADQQGRRRVSALGQVDPAVTPEVTRRARHRRPTSTALSPNELMNAILKAPVDLLWNGGIGTYVKASGETHADVGDRANNALRVDGRELRCKVVGEGGNLGLTQLRPHRGGAARRAAQHRLHRQLRRRGHLRPRGQHQDPAQRRGAEEEAHAATRATSCWRR